MSFLEASVWWTFAEICIIFALVFSSNLLTSGQQGVGSSGMQIRFSPCKVSPCYASADHVKLTTDMNDCIDHDGHVDPRCHGDRRDIPVAHHQFTYSTCLSFFGVMATDSPQPDSAVNGEVCLSN